jgi:hypothetical protein
MPIHIIDRDFGFFPCNLSSNMQIALNNFFLVKQLIGQAFFPYDFPGSTSK